MRRTKSEVPIDALEAMSMENLLALDDDHLSRFANLCNRWFNLADQERKRRAKR